MLKVLFLLALTGICLQGSAALLSETHVSDEISIAVIHPFENSQDSKCLFSWENDYSDSNFFNLNPQSNNFSVIYLCGKNTDESLELKNYKVDRVCGWQIIDSLFLM